MPIRFQVDPDFYDHPKALDLSDAAVALWTRAGSYSAAKTSDGFVAERVLALLSKTPREAAEELRRCGLWHKVRGGYQFHEWEVRNLTRSRIEADRRADRERKKGDRAAKKDPANGSRPHGEDDAHPAGTNGKPQAVPENVRPESERSPEGIQPESEWNPDVSVSVSVSGSESGSGRKPRPAARCPEHLDDPDPPPCGRCKDARQAHEQWEVDRIARITNAPKCRIHRGQLAHNCSGCIADQKVAAVVAAREAAS